MEDGFTPVFADIARQVGATGALVYGLVWRFAEMRDGECHASLRTMHEQSGLSRHTLRSHLEDLCAKGLIEKTREATPRVPAWYRVVIVSKIARSFSQGGKVAPLGG